MSEEKIKILDMLKEGKITAEQATELLKHVSDEDGGRYGYHQYRWESYLSHLPNRMDFEWINDLRSALKDKAYDIARDVHDITQDISFPDEYMDEIMHSSEQERFTAGLSCEGGIRELAFDCKSAPLKLETYGGDRIEVKACFKTKSGWNPHLNLTDANGVVSLNYDDNALYILGISVRVPETAHIESVRLKNRNAPISIYDIDAEKIELSTINQPIKVSNTKVKYLYCETKSMPITLDNVDVYNARLITSTAKINTKNSNIVQLYAKTSNSPLRFDDLGCGEPVCSIEAITTNGQISINLPHRVQKCKLRASTTSGGIFSELNDLEYKVNERNYVEAHTYGYDTAQNKLSLNLQTTHYGIYVKQ